jgi:uncharacterized protein with ParB-like and HNH nuclease domain
MQASETKLQPIIEGTKQYVVPLFQRSYSWENKEWEILWNDLKDLCKADKPRTHFIGSIVTMPTISVPEGVTKYLLIDGQQRLTTIFVLLSFLRDRAKENGDAILSDEIANTLLVNPYKKDFDYYKLLPTQTDRSSFQNLIQFRKPEGQDQISNAYIFFRKKFQQNDIDIQTLKKVICNNLSVVSVVLGIDDDPHLVFESLNAKGRPLTQSDLIRNFFFMRIHINQQEDIYAKYWKPMQETLNTNLTEYIRHYLIKDGSWVKESDVYFALKELIGDSETLEHLKDIASFAEYYKKLLYPEEYENDLAIRKGLSRLNRIGSTTAYPFLLNCYRAYERNQIPNKEFLEILSTLENFMIRRFICHVPTNQLNKIFSSLFSQVQNRISGSFLEGMRKILQTKDYPKDGEFKARLADTRLYGNNDRTAKAKLILETIEETYKHKEEVDFKNLTVEHIMPQTLTEDWQNHLGAEWEQTHELHLHVIGNLTLTAYNSELSNSSFENKKNLLNESHLEINKYFRDKKTWIAADIDWRSYTLAGIALNIWSYFGDQVESSEQADVTGKTPDTLFVLGQILKVQSWSDVVVFTLNTIAELEPEKFQKVFTRFPKQFGKEKLIRARELNNGLFVEANVSAKAAYRFCQQALEEADLTSDDWQIKLKVENL